MPRTALILLLVATLLPACSEQARLAREIGDMDQATALQRAADVQKQGMDAYGSVEDEASAQTAAATLDLCAYQLEQLADRFRTLGAPSAQMQIDVLGDNFGGLLSSGLGALGSGLKLMGQPKLLAILDPAYKRFEAATDELNGVLEGS